MRKVLMMAAALAMLSVAAAPASAQKLDKNGRCHDKTGTPAKPEVCGFAPVDKRLAKPRNEGPLPMPTASTSAPGPTWLSKPIKPEGEGPPGS
jgi:hypothetical protein